MRSKTKTLGRLLLGSYFSSMGSLEDIRILSYIIRTSPSDTIEKNKNLLLARFRLCFPPHKKDIRVFFLQSSSGAPLRLQLL